MNKLSMSEEEMLKRKYTRPYEKRIAELEKENKVLAQNLEDTEIINNTLEKENAELKEKYNELSKAVFELKGEFMACPLDDTDRLGELIDRLNNL